MPARKPQLYWNQVQAGETLPTGFSMKLDMYRLALEASGTQDFYPAHYDREFAQKQQGLPDVFANTMFLNAMLERTLTDWMGDDGELLAFRMQMRKMVLLGDTMTTKGIVTGKQIDRDTSQGIVEIDLWIETDREGVATTARAKVALPVST